MHSSRMRAVRCSSRRVYPGGVHPPCTESQTPVKTLPCHNYVAGGNNRLAPPPFG